jgi:hypothetical protein
MRSFGIRQAEQPAWRKASLCQSGECVEITKRRGMIILRSSKGPRGISVGRRGISMGPYSRVYYTPQEWQTFIGGVKAGEFDDLVT